MFSSMRSFLGLFLQSRYLIWMGDSNVCECFLLDILLIGCGRRMQRVGDDVRSFLRSSGIKLETVDSVYQLSLLIPASHGESL